MLLVQHAKQLGDGEQAALEEQLAGASYEGTGVPRAPRRAAAVWRVRLRAARAFYADWLRR